MHSVVSTTISFTSDPGTRNLAMFSSRNRRRMPSELPIITSISIINDTCDSYPGVVSRL